MISINLYEIFMQMVNFSILLFLVNKFLIKPVDKVLKDRAKSIQSRVDECESNKLESEKLLQDQKDCLKEARLEAKTIRKNAEDASKKEQDKLMYKAQQDANVLLENAKKDISLQITRAKKELLDDAGKSAVALCSQLLKKEFTEKDQKNLMAQTSKVL